MFAINIWHVNPLWARVEQIHSPHLLQLCLSATLTNLHLAMRNWLVVGPPLWKIWKSIGMIIPNIWENKPNVPNHQLGKHWSKSRYGCMADVLPFLGPLNRNNSFSPAWCWLLLWSIKSIWTWKICCWFLGKFEERWWPAACGSLGTVDMIYKIDPS